MSAYNVVRFRVKPGREAEFVEGHRRMTLDWAGLRKAAVIKTGDRSYCMVGEWDSMEKLAAARPKMIATLDTFRDALEDLGEGLGLTDPVSGEAVVELASQRPSRQPQVARA